MINSLLVHAYFLIQNAAAQAPVFDAPGDGLQIGIDVASEIEGLRQEPLREVILDYLYLALSFLAMAGVIMIIAAGIYMVVSGGDETAKDKAKKIILYVVIGLVIVFLARSIVGFFVNGLQ